ncbi:MAG: hypothetical protein AAFY46_14645, partial [Planctomycetota bacterium]
ISEKAQKQWGLACAGLGAALMVAAWAALGAAVITDPRAAHELEKDLIVEKHGVDYLGEIEAKYPAPTVEQETDTEAEVATSD